MRTMKRLVLCLLYIGILASCTPTGTTLKFEQAAPGQIRRQRLWFPPARYWNVEYLAGRLVGFADRNSKSHPWDRDFFAYQGHNHLHPFNLYVDRQTCDINTQYIVNGVLPDGRLGLLKQCLDDRGSLTGTFQRFVYALDWQTGQLQDLVHSLSLPSWSLRDYSWNPTMTRGVGTLSPGFEGTIFWITPTGAAPMNITIEDQGLSWNLEDYYDWYGGPLPDQPKVGLAGGAAWSPDGNTIAFFATNYGMRETPEPVFNLREELYFMDPVTLKPFPVIQDVANVGVPLWSPDSKRLAFNGCLGWPLECGIWVYNVQAKSVLLVDTGGDINNTIGVATWVDNDTLIGIRDKSWRSQNNHVFEYFIGPLPSAP